MRSCLNRRPPRHGADAPAGAATVAVHAGPTLGTSTALGCGPTLSGQSWIEANDLTTFHARTP